MAKGIITVVFLLAACGTPGETEASTTTAAFTTTLEPLVTTSSSAARTTTTSVVTTTTSVETTTTVVSTTTSATLVGEWADEPLIVTEFGALGWWDGSEWVSAEEVGALPVEGGEDYQVSLLGEGSITTGGVQEIVCEPPGNLGVELQEDDLLGDWPGPVGVAVSADWSLHPHLFESFDDDGTNAGVARELLASRGLAVDSPAIKQLYRTDLEGDGTNEVLVVAEEVSEGLFAREGDYSIIFMRKVVGGEVQTAVLGESVITEPDGFLVSFTIGTVADLNGEGTMEIVVDSAYYEGIGSQVWEYVDDEFGPVPRLSMGCGA